VFQVNKGTETWSHIGLCDNSGWKGPQDLRVASAVRSDKVTHGFIQSGLQLLQKLDANRLLRSLMQAP